MAQFSFAYNIGDIVTFVAGTTAQGAPYNLRGTINTILISGDCALYMIQTRYAQHPVAETDIVRPIFSSKSFDVFYPGVEVMVKQEDGTEVAAYVENAIISNGRLIYQLTDLGCSQIFEVPESHVRLANCGLDNINNFQ
ncbi:hypothetical protein pEaSNUABM14_00151 [Erwinia phage pEa_SNUABM_14]|uniref:Uncharacterized protein n=1 Tax=Erwinia phage pEa_SNUABM_7 TaxID=2866695 RepID=A0AAE7WTD5_9CAUD|nr:hypothetical protein MPK74_gp152 [Erwinia phage pEa_SNUABM_7]QYW03111.1 hypothetical protein pEaSNUABM13_00152 [Erwinia phage pEa_SNUABM_13]QYW03452.1 hypothetical protein pEaSNUABM34_00150 [Erwinia phage pEa_SNUABM_34]QYW03794.1 hypothetical protein pEaSNUABM45_00151 [Erwinia phage pEa_SNUABM_45]QYW04135.1 hypothetical protein pEaSNUABM46_00151 [Erwinia phage pEa_SNUABM_46]QYW04476.1 hypothetical protein pEaSNUABM14_00151 [Erwinia phage pEa_SNUABM_14]QYW05165.1 hypothetical protein pEaSNU